MATKKEINDLALLQHSNTFATSNENLPFPPPPQQELQRVTQLIVETIVPEKIILYGSYATGEWQEDRYTEKHLVYSFDSDYDILVITKSGDRRKEKIPLSTLTY